MSALHLRLLFSDHGTDSFKQKIHQIESHQGEVYIWEDGHPWLTHTNSVSMLETIRKATIFKLYLIVSGNMGLPKHYYGFEVIEISYIVTLMMQHNYYNQKYLKLPSCSKGFFSFLTGKPLGYHRVGLLYKIWKHGLIGNCQYSFFGNTDEF
jgi:hypothetical protein